MLLVYITTLCCELKYFLCVSVSATVISLCVDAYYVENLIARVSTCICPTESKYQSQLLTFYDDFQIIFQH
jgi:hypothetical protein